MAAEMPRQSGAAEAAAPPPRTTAWGDCTLSALCSGAQHGALSQANKYARGHEERAGMEGWPPSGAPLSVAADRRGQPPPQQMAIGPPRRCRLPVRPPRRFALARQPSKNSEARALCRGAPSAKMCSVASCRSNPMATRRHSFAIGRRSQERICSRRRALACAHDGARLPSRLAVGRSLFFGGGRTWVH